MNSPPGSLRNSSFTSSRITSGSRAKKTAAFPVLNVALFGKTARMWRDEHPESKGNIRDEASLRELIVLVNLESMNAELIKLGLSRLDRASRLNKMAIEQLRVLDETDEKRLLEG